jgi:ubiquinone/menaquinone biosynthesis C-methylase UbiE
MDTTEPKGAKDEYQGTEGTHPYAGAGWYYAEYREHVSEELITRLAHHLGWSHDHRVLDLGAGPAPLSLRVAPLVAEMVAVDPEPDMLMEGQRRARLAGATNIMFVLASSDDLPAIGPRLGVFRAALMGDSFHWMVMKDHVLLNLSKVIDPTDGTVVFITSKRVSIPDALQDATACVHAVLERYLQDAPPGPHPRGRHDPFEVILARSPFPNIDTIEYVYEVRVQPTVEALIGAEYSMSHVLTRLGSRRARFEQDARAALVDLGEIGEINLTRRDEALIGKR